jgi:Kdo2-lipid IVA lauroyltransferase/acyltransferase
MIPAQHFRSSIRAHMQNQYALALVADQSPPNGGLGHWLYFFNRPAAFLTGPDKGARRDNMAVIFVNFIKIKRGYYRFESEVISENGSEFREGELTCLYRDFLEKSIRERPANYLWSHRRWKFEYKPEFQKRWVDKKPPEII